MKYSFLLSAAVVLMSQANFALAHGNEDHGSMGNMSNTPIQGHNTQPWQSTWTQSNNPNYGYYQQYQGYFQKHPTDHRVLEQSEAQYHELLRQGRITQREHEMLDAQLQAQHAQKDSGVQNNFNRYGYPYANQKMPRLINKLPS